MPDTVKYGISNFTWIGTFEYFSLASSCIDGNPNDARIKNSFLPGNYLMTHTMQFLSGTYFTVPTFDLNAGESTSLGTGTIISTLFAIDFCLNCVLAFTTYSILDFE